MWTAYLGVHSLLAADFIKKKFHNQQYRLFYNIVAVVGLLPIGFMISVFPGAQLFAKSTATDFVGLVFATYGVLLIRKAFKAYNFRAFLGLEPGEERQKLQTDGLFAKVRHPVYAGTILICVGLAIYAARVAALISALSILAYLPIGIWLEEQKLLKQFGDQYRKYCAEVPAIIPKFKK